MKKKKTIEIIIPAGRIVDLISQGDGSYKMTIELEDKGLKNLDKFVHIEASKLSLNDTFMKHVPKSSEEKELKEFLGKFIQRGIKDFWIPRFAPSLTDDGKGICYEFGRKPVLGKTERWWKTAAESYDPKRKSRIISDEEYIALLGVLIKTLVLEGWTVEDAWYAVCTNSKQLYWECDEDKCAFSTVSKGIFDFVNLPKTYRYLIYDEESSTFWLACGRTSLWLYLTDYSVRNSSVALIVLEE